jgi:hypothetical protein
VEYRLRVGEKKVLGKIFGPKWEKELGDWRRLHNEELHEIYSSLDIIRVIKSRRGRHVARGTWHVCERTQMYSEFLLGRCRHECEDNIMIDLKETGRRRGLD